MVLLASASLPAAGTFLLGLFVGYLVRYFVIRLNAYRVTALSVIVAVVLGGTVTGFLMTDDIGRSVRWWYPVGVLAGWMSSAIIGWITDVFNRRGRS
jgi:hypothetical protein